MAKLKAYEWERNKYPKHHTIKIDEAMAKNLIKQFAKRFNVVEPTVVGGAWWGGGKYFAAYRMIKLCYKNISLGTVIHEFAHHLDWIRNNHRGHTGKFKNELMNVYSFADCSCNDSKNLTDGK